VSILVNHHRLGAAPLKKTTLYKINKISIHVIDHQSQRYETAGDWQLYPGSVDEEGDYLTIRASRLKDDPNNFFALAVAYHELGEALGCIANGVTQKQVDDFDLKFKGKGEPGDDPKSPYQLYHGFATACERILIGAMGLSWGMYEKAINSLPKWRKKNA
jgi:hypothetical protein